jgi:hypothetical protein
MHAESLDAMLPQDQLLSPIHVPLSNVHQFLQTDQVLRLQPPKHILSLLLCKPSQERNRHAMDIPTLARLGCVDITVCIYPNDSHFSVQTLPDGFRSTSDCANGD